MRAEWARRACRTVVWSSLVLATPAAGADDEEGPCPPVPASARAVHVGPSGTITDPRPIFRWLPAEGYHEYVFKLLYAPDDGGYVDPPGDLIDVEGTSWEPPSDLPIGVPMRWAVKIYCTTPAGERRYGPYTPASYFTITAGGSAPCPPPDPGAVRPTPREPVGAIADRRPTFRWQPVPGYQYVLRIVYARTDARPVRPPGGPVEVAQTTWKPPADLPAGLEMSWAVRAFCTTPDGQRMYGDYSPETSFTIRRRVRP